MRAADAIAVHIDSAAESCRPSFSVILRQIENRHTVNVWKAIVMACLRRVCQEAIGAETDMYSGGAYPSEMTKSARLILNSRWAAGPRSGASGPTPWSESL